MVRSSSAVALAAAAAALFTAAPASAAHLNLDAFALTTHDELVTFVTGTPDEPASVTPISGLMSGDTLVGIDVRPRTGVLYGVGSGSTLYTIDTDTATATFVAPISVPLDGAAFGVDFNPAADRLRVTSDRNQNLRIVPTTGVSVDGGTIIGDGTDDPLNYGPMGANPDVVGSAYTNNDADQFQTPVPATPTGTELFDIDTAFDTLVKQDPPNNGTLTTRGSLGFSARNDVGFDIYSGLDSTGRAVSNTAFASFGKGGTEKLYTIDLVNGTASLIDAFGRNAIRDIAIATIQD